MKTLLSIALVLLAFALAIPAANAAVITSCPVYGNDSGCGFLITINAAGVGSVAAASGPAQGTYDGATGDDTSIGIVNNWTHTLTSIILTATKNIFQFDGDGPCTALNGTANGGLPSADCGTGSNSYGGRHGIDGSSSDVTFSAINVAFTSGTVTFTQGIPVGGTAWFALEADINGASLTVPVVSSTPEPATLALVGCGLLAAGIFRARRRRR